MNIFFKKKKIFIIGFTLCILTIILLGITNITQSKFNNSKVSGGNYITSGSVYANTNDNNTPMFNENDLYPDDPITKCIKITYEGSLEADVKLMITTSLGDLAPYLNLVIKSGQFSSGSPTFPSCSNFVEDDEIFSGTLQGFASAHNSYANGLISYPEGKDHWNTNDNVVYQVILSLQNNQASEGLTTSPFNITWEAKNK